MDEVTGDENADIFDGLTVSSGFFSKPRYIPSERVREITDGCVQLDLSRAEVEGLPEYEEPPASVQISSENAGVADRAAAPFVDEGETPAPTTTFRRWIDRLLGR